MTFGGEVDDVTRVHQRAIVMDKHLARRKPSGLAGRLVLREVGRESLLELQGDTLAHIAHAIHGVHHRLGVGHQQVALCALDHRLHLSNTNAASP
ncbi:hypothetical protein FQZ97_1009850 [compost metagenome]